MRLPPRSSVMILISIGLLIVLISTYTILAKAGFQHTEPASALRLAEQEWEAGCRGQSLKGYIRASTMAVDAGARWTIAHFYVKRMTSNTSAGRLDKALANCSQAAALLHNYDDEGSLSYECFALEAEIKRQDEME